MTIWSILRKGLGRLVGHPLLTADQVQPITHPSKMRLWLTVDDAGYWVRFKLYCPPRLRPVEIGFLLLDKKGPNAWEISKVEVAETFQSHGFGSMLVQNALRYVRERKGRRVTGWVERDDLEVTPHLLDFWTRQGFTVRPGEDGGNVVAYLNREL